MTTKRVPKLAAGRIKITDHAVENFKDMQLLPCTCTAPRRARCEGCERWWELHRELLWELDLAPWEFPAVMRCQNGLAYVSDWDGARELIHELMERLRAAYPDVYVDLRARYDREWLATHA